MLRIGLLFEYATLNGGEWSVLAALDRLFPKQLDVVALVPPQGPLVDQLADRNIPSIPMAWRGADGGRIPLESLVQSLSDLVRGERVDLLHANSLAMGRILGAAAQDLPCPTSAHLRDIVKLSRRAVSDLNQHTGLVAVSHATREFHIEQGLRSERVQTIYNGVDIERFRPRPRTGWLHRELGLPLDTQLAATIGQICLRKGQNDLASAATLLRDECPRLHFLLIGERHSSKVESIAYDRHLSETFATAGMTQRLHRLGFRSDIPAVLNEVDALVHPARQEPLGRVLLEAGSSGCPIVATDVGGTSEILQHCESAWLVPAASPDQLAEGIRQVLGDGQLARSLGDGARRFVAEHFAVESVIDGLLDFWMRVATGRFSSVD